MPAIDVIYEHHVPHMRRALYDALSTGREIHSVEDFRPVFDDVEQVVVKAVGNYADLYDINVLAEQYAANRAAKRIVNINEETRSSIQSTLARGIADGLTDEQMANRLKSKVGLTPQMSQAVDNYRDGLLKAGMKPGAANVAAKKYTDELRLARATSIAQTEVAAAFNVAQRLVWRQAVETGDLSDGVKTVWKTHPAERTCERCRNLNGKTVSLMNPGTGYKAGKITVSAPPLHPHCRCTEEVVDVLGKSIPEFNELSV